MNFSQTGHAVRRRGLTIAASFVLALAISPTASGYSPAQPTVGPYASCAAYPPLAPTFRWGSFGVQRHSPRVSWGRDYNGELVRWAYLRR